ncbi:ribokinase [Bowmanella sp. Y26]|uniref:ribokinase n=1 Tax=Bowmanella yangjiangensis TaxID=2811230 RepID=UPI001BDCEF1C|nr:ribokinase [Bowmanella yangjiangensis]MBT1065949.1 ribokinase [Bowmanella yangjiangensis]
MSIYNLGSINWDHCYRVSHFVRPGETLMSSSYQLHLGGKGANQSVAAAKAGASIVHIGSVGLNDSAPAKLRELGVDISGISGHQQEATGHALIQIDDQGENAIILHAGANRAQQMQWVAAQLQIAGPQDWLLMQNETNLIVESAELAKQKGMRVAFNPAPMDRELTLRLLDKLDLLIVNQIEAQDLTGTDDLDAAIAQMQRMAPNLALLITLGSAGACHCQGSQRHQVKAFKVDAVDTTAAGDTFIGYFLANISAGQPVAEALRQASAAAAIAVTRAGAIPSIPVQQEVADFLATQS